MLVFVLFWLPTIYCLKAHRFFLSHGASYFLRRCRNSEIIKLATCIIKDIAKIKDIKNIGSL